MARRVMLTTIDNPYDPFSQFDNWYAYDQAADYHTTALLGRIVIMSDELSESDENQAVEDAIDEIVRENPLGLYRKVVDDTGIAA